MSYVLKFILTFVMLIVTQPPAQVDAAMKSEALMNKRIFFGHQSVGENILNGITLNDASAKQYLYETSYQQVADYPDTGLLHRRVGKNNDPRAKIDDFASVVRDELKGQVDVAFVKLCYVDFSKNTDVQALFDYYKMVMADLKHDFPEVTFVHMTAPLTQNPENWKTKIKKITGMGALWEYENNIKRNQYRELLIGEYEGREPVFDIARIEAETPDGSLAQFSLDGKDYYSMAAELTSDGGHLNDVGSRKVAGALLDLISKLD